MLLTRPCHSVEFMEKYNAYVETHIFRTEKQPDFEQYIPYTTGLCYPHYAQMS